MTSDGKWVREAVAQQEEYLKRRGFCLGQPFREHKFIDAAKGGWRGCAYCSVTETDADYNQKIGVRP